MSTFLLALALILLAMLLMGQTALTNGDDPVDGKDVFEQVCTTCHTVQPPPTLAPPMAMIVRHYRMARGDSAAVREALVSWISAPDASRSLLPDHAIERFGVMAPLALTPDEIDAVAGYIMTLQPEMGGEGMMGEGGMMGGMKGQNGKGMMQGDGMHGGMQMGQGMMRMDSTAAMSCPRSDSTAAMSCPRMDSTAAMSCPRTDSTATMSCPRTDSTAASQKCGGMKGGARPCKMNH